MNSPAVVLIDLVYVLSCIRGAYTSWRLLQVNITQLRDTIRDLRSAGADDAALAMLRDEIDIARTRIWWRGFRFWIAVAGLVLGVGAFFPAVTTNPFYGLLFTAVFLSFEGLLTYLNEREYQRLELGHVLPWLWRQVHALVTGHSHG